MRWKIIFRLPSNYKPPFIWPSAKRVQPDFYCSGYRLQGLIPAGLLLQRLPTAGADPTTAGADDNTLPDLDTDGWTRSLKLAETVTSEELLELDAESLLHRLYHQEIVRLFDARSICFECACSRQRTSGVIQSLGVAEAQDILKEQGRLSGG